jgi:hypothetical protein
MKLTPSPAIERIDIVADNIHADAAAGHAGDLGSGREPRREDEFMDLRFGQLADLGRAGESLRHRLGFDALGIETAAIVGDLDDDLTAFLIRGQPNQPVLRLAGGAAFGRRLEAMVGGIAYHVGERILDQIEYLAIQLGLGAVHFEIDLFAEFGAEIAHDARQLLPRIADRLHASFHHALLQLGGDVREPL